MSFPIAAVWLKTIAARRTGREWQIGLVPTTCDLDIIYRSGKLASKLCKAVPRQRHKASIHPQETMFKQFATLVSNKPALIRVGFATRIAE